MEILQRVIMLLVPLILSLTVHEFAHALMAFKLGDDTARSQGRMTLNPLVHMDLFGTLIIPGIAAVTGVPFLFGWAKPVPVNPVRFTRRLTMRTGMLIVSAVGPLSNLLLAIVVAIIARVASLPLGGEEPVGMLLGLLYQINIILFIFNLLPIPPLDGSKILAGILPESASKMFLFFERNQFVSFIFLIAILQFGGVILGYPFLAIDGVIRWLIGV